MSAGSVSGMEYETDSLLRIFDDLLQTYEVQINERQQRIDELKNKSDRESQSVSELYNLNQQFYNEYRPYISDSAIYYQKGIPKNLQIRRLKAETRDRTK